MVIIFFSFIRFIFQILLHFTIFFSFSITSKQENFVAARKKQINRFFSSSFKFYTFLFLFLFGVKARKNKRVFSFPFFKSYFISLLFYFLCGGFYFSPFKSYFILLFFRAVCQCKRSKYIRFFLFIFQIILQFTLLGGSSMQENKVNLVFSSVKFYFISPFFFLSLWLEARTRVFSSSSFKPSFISLLFFLFPWPQTKKKKVCVGSSFVVSPRYNFLSARVSKNSAAEKGTTIYLKHTTGISRQRVCKSSPPRQRVHGVSNPLFKRLENPGKVKQNHKLHF